MASYNKVIILGRLCADPELKTTPNGVPVVSVRVAVGRRFAKPDDEVQADFFYVVCWRNNAEFMAKHFTKGKSVLIDGQLQNRSYTDKSGANRVITEIVADSVFFGESKANETQDKSGAGNYAQASTNRTTAQQSGAYGATQQRMTENPQYVELGSEDELPF
ncbi:MAG: single-stranded DNA-binding protein [Eubacteriales bacterium]